jgi:hypothetical protein
VYTLICLLAVLHILGLIAGAGYLYANGKLTRDNVRTIYELLTGEAAADEGEAASTDRMHDEVAGSEEAIAREQNQEEMTRRAVQRKMSELYQKQTAVKILLQKTLEDRERLDSDRGQFEQEKRVYRAKEQETGFKKQIEYLKTSPPEVAKVLLFESMSPEEAAAALLQINARQGMKALQAGLEDQLYKARAVKVFTLVREVAPEDSEWADVPAPTP